MEDKSKIRITRKIRKRNTKAHNISISEEVLKQVT